MPVSLKNNTKGEYYPPQLLSQKLNNRAAFLITTGHYEEGIALLTKALKLTSNSQADTPADQHQATCNCKACSLESCLIMEHDPSMSSLMIDQLTSTQNQVQQQEQEDKQGYYCPKPNTSSSSSSSSSNDEMFHRASMGLCSLPATAAQLGSRNAQQRRNLKSPSTLSTSTESSSSSPSAVDTSTATATTTITDFGFVYRRPLLVNQQCIDEMHDMGTTLSLLILFNLALAHHLKAIASFNTQQVSSSLSNSSFKTKKSSLKALQQALQLYELAYQLHIDYIQQSEESSSVSNNNQQPQESESSSSNNNNNGNDNNSDDAYNRSIGSLRFTMIISNNLGEIHHAIGNTGKHTLCLQHLLSAIMYVVDSNLVVLDSNEMDGFYSNVAPIMGLSNKDICAQAA
jgi:tetratricopeptide (TPR) repeat protein